MTIYLDVIIMENLCMNYIILFATGMIQKAKIKQWRILISSFIGALYSILSFLPVLEIYTNVVFKFILSLVMVYIAFHPAKVKILVKELILFYLVSFAFGGCAFFLLYFIRPQDILMRNGVLTGTYPIKIALLGGIVGFIVVNASFKMIKGRVSKKDMFCDVEILWKEKHISLKAMIDTGNLLKDPISGIPVIVVEAKQLEDMIPEKVLEHLNEILSGGEMDMTEELTDESVPKFRIIPFSSLGKQNGLLLGFIADSIIIQTEEEKTKVDHVIVGIYEKSLTKNGAYTGLIGLDILERCEKNEYYTNLKR